MGGHLIFHALCFCVLCILNSCYSSVPEHETTPSEPTTQHRAKRLPVGIRSIRQILEHGYIYVDKTGLIFDLLLELHFDYFMVRPSGFGKSLFLSTLEEIFKGNKQLFEGTAIHRSQYKWMKFPVLRFDFSRMDCRDPNKFETTLVKELKRRMKANDIAAPPPDSADTLRVQLKYLIEGLSKKSGTRVVILVDEYDAPITNNVVTDIQTAQKCRTIISHFIGNVTKLSNDFLQFTFVTGVHQFSVCGDQGWGDNYLVDISLNPRYATMMGFTREELEIYFDEYVVPGVNESHHRISTENVLDKAREHCDRHRFTENEISVYNPQSILTYLATSAKSSSAGGESNSSSSSSVHAKIPSFLVESIRNDPQLLLNLRNDGSKGFSRLQLPVDIDTRIDLERFVFQMGYYTIHGYNESLHSISHCYDLDFLNENAKNAFFRVLLEGLTKLDVAEIGRDGEKMRRDLVKLDVDNFMTTLHTHISKIPMQLRHNATLENYNAIFYLLMENYGFDMKIEADHSRTEVDDLVSYFELTVDQSAAVARDRVMDAVSEKGKKMLFVGVSINVETSNINEWKPALNEDGKITRDHFLDT